MQDYLIRWLDAVCSSDLGWLSMLILHHPLSGQKELVISKWTMAGVGLRLACVIGDGLRV